MSKEKPRAPSASPKKAPSPQKLPEKTRKPLSPAEKKLAEKFEKERKTVAGQKQAVAWSVKKQSADARRELMRSVAAKTPQKAAVAKAPARNDAASATKPAERPSVAAVPKPDVVKKDPKRVDTEKVEGVRLAKGSLLAGYLFGIDSPASQKYLEKGAYEIPETLETDFRRNLDSMWRKKIAGAKNPEKVTKFYEERVVPYLNGTKKPTKTDLASYVREMGDTVGAIQKKADSEKAWAKFGDDLWGKDKNRGQKDALFEALAKSVTTTDLLSYSLTELMDSSHTEMNLKVLDILLRNAGREYVDLLPSMNDRILSFWPYQHTIYSIGEEGGANKAQRRLFGKGATFVQPEIGKISGREHHAGAYLLTLESLGLFVRDLEPKETSTLLRILPKRQNPEYRRIFSEFFGTSHNNPRLAKEAFRQFLAEGGKGGKTLMEYVGPSKEALLAALAPKKDEKPGVKKTAKAAKVPKVAPSVMIAAKHSVKVGDHAEKIRKSPTLQIAMLDETR